MRTDESRVLRKGTVLYANRDTGRRGVDPVGKVGDDRRKLRGAHYLADGTDLAHPPQINIRADEELHADIDEISHDARITNRSDAIRYAVRKEAQRIRRRRKADK